MRTHNLAIGIIALLTILTLTSGKPMKTNENEAIVIGRITVDSKKKLNRNNISIRFENKIKGDKSCKVDADGFFVAKIGKDKSFIDHIEYKKDGKYRKRFMEDCATLNLVDGQKVYYIGDIHLKWTPSKEDRVRKAFSVSVGVGAVHSDDGGDISVQSSYKPEEACHDLTIGKSKDAISWYKKNHPNEDREIETILIRTL